MNSLRQKLKQRLGTRSVLLLVLALGFLARLPGLGRDVWYDEAVSLFDARGADVLTTKIIPNGPEFTNDMFMRDGGWRESLQAIGHGELNPPLYFLLLRLWIKTFGESNRVLRSLSVIFGLATILAVFLLGRKMFDERIGLAAAGVLAILPLHIQYSQEIRPYALSVLLVTFASLVYWRAYQAVGQREERRYWLFYTGLVTASFYTHYFTPGVFAAHGLFALMQPRSLRLALVKRLGLVAAVSLALLMPWLFSHYLTDQWQFLKVQTPSPPFWASDLHRRLAFLAYYLSAGNLPGANLKSISGLILLSLYVTSALSLISIARRQEKPQALLFAFLLLSVPILFASSMGAVFDKVVVIALARYVLSALVGLSILLGAGIMRSRPRAVAFLIAGLSIAVSLQFQVQWHRVNKSSTPLPFAEWAYGDFSSAVAEVSRRASMSELILFDDWMLAPTWNAYPQARIPQLFMGRGSFYANEPMDFDSRWLEVERKYTDIVLVRRAGEPPSEVVERLDRHYQLSTNERIGRLEIRRYIKPSRATSVNVEHR